MDPSFVSENSVVISEASDVSSNTEIDGTQGAIPKSNSQTNIHSKKSGRFGGLRFSFGKRKSNVAPIDDAPSQLADDLKKTKKSKKDKNQDNKNKKNGVSAPALEIASETLKSEISSLASLSRKTSLPEENFPIIKRQTSKSKIGSTLVRKISFGKLKSKSNRSRVSPDISPTISNEDLDAMLSSFAGSGSRHGPKGNDKSADFIRGETFVIPVETDHSLSDDKLDNEQGPNILTECVAAENNTEMQEKSIQSEEMWLEKGGNQSGSSYPGRRESINQSERTKNLLPECVKDDGSFYVLDTDFKKPHQFGEVSSSYPVVVAPHNVATDNNSNSHFNLDDSEIALVKRVASSDASESSTLVGQVLEPVSVVEKSIEAVSSKLSKREDDVVNTADVHKSSFAEKTFQVRSAWMSEQMNKDVNTRGEKQKQLVFSKKSTKSQILSITTPMLEKQKLEDDSKEILERKDEIFVEKSDLPENGSEEPTTPPNVDRSVAGSSKSDVYLTPRDSPSPNRMSLSEEDFDVKSESERSVFFTPDAVRENDAVEVLADIKSAETSPMRVGEDVMAEARAKLSQSLGVASSLASQTQVGDKREHLYKILVIGELGTGKTSIIKRYVHQFFSQHYRATIGVDFALKVLNWDANTIIRLQLWDIAGQERFGNMTRVYYKEAVGAFIVFDVTRAATFDAVVKWKQDLDSKVQLPDGSSIPCVLLANKCDQQKEGLVNNPGKMDEYCKERGFSGWFETSAKENINIEEAARSLVTKILQNDQLRIQNDSSRDVDKFNLGGHNAQDEKTKSKCSC